MTVFPASFAQQRLWFLDQLEPGSPLYNLPFVIRIDGHLDVEALRRTFNEVVRRHEALRTTFAAGPDGPTQIIADTMIVALPVVDAMALPAAEHHPTIERLAREEARRPFDLSTGPLLRARLLALGPHTHVLFLTMHHIVSDGWSLGVLFREVAAIYEAFSNRRSSPLPSLPIQYADFAVWQRETLQGPAQRGLLDYWKARLANAPAILELPADKTRPAVQEFHGAQAVQQLSPRLTAQLKQLSAGHRVTLFMTLLAAFKVLLWRYTNQTDIVIGSPIANRTRAETEALIGFFVNTLALRTDLSGNPPFTQLLERVKEVALGAYQHQDLPFEQLVEELSPDRDPGRNPLFQVAFVLQNATRSRLELPGLTLERLDVHSGTAKFDLSLSILELDGGLTTTWEYDAELYEPGRIARMIDHFEMLLEGVIAAPQTRIGDLPLLPAREREQLLIEWNRTAVSYPEPHTVHELFEAQVDRTPDAIAVIDERRRLTYAELERRSNQLAWRLRRAGVGCESLVAVCMERSVDLVVALLGILKAGGAYVPLDPTYPQPRLRFMLEDAQADVLISQRQLATQLPQVRGAVLWLDEEQERPLEDSDTRPPRLSQPESLAYVIYTSGSTGQPKGVAIEHRSTVALLRWAQNLYEPQDLSAVLASTSICFDLSVFELFLPISVGGMVLIAEDALHLTSGSWGVDPTLINTVPSAMAELLRLDGIPASARVVNLAGEPLPQALVQELYERRGIARVYDLYGPTEDTTYSTVALRRPMEPPTIGRPIANTQIYLLDARRQPVPIGIPGELYIGGAGLARGYLNRPELTAEKFVPNPYGEAGTRLYRTGDIARYRADGSLQYLGRSDQQVKVRGYRIELGEIEAAINEHPAARESVAIVREDDPGDKRLVAYVVPERHDDSVAGGSDALGAGQLTHWKTVWDEIYEDATSPSDPRFNITGWNSSYTGTPIPPEEMSEWVNSTIQRIRRRSPQRVLEIGCGSGLLLFRLAPDCARYHGTDLSQTAIDSLTAQVADADLGSCSISLSQQAADDFSGIEASAFDIVILNSVVQYFPGVDYLMRVLEGAIAALRPGGSIFVGDVRNLQLLDAFHTSVQLHNAPSSLPARDLRQRVQKQVQHEKELVLDPAFFRALPRRFPDVADVHVELKRGQYVNELTRFRYDVTLHIGSSEPTSQRADELDWLQEGGGLDRLKQVVAGSGADAITVRNLPNARVSDAVSAAALLRDDDECATAGELRERVRERTQSETTIDPEDVRALADSLGYVAEVTWSVGSAGHFDATFHRPHVTAASQQHHRVDADPDWARYANNPIRADLSHALEPDLRKWLAVRLPEPMIPSHFVILDALPRTANGKLDRKALPTPHHVRPDLEEMFVGPRTAFEEQVAAVWAEVLKLKAVGVHDNFFELGGHSLLGTQVISRLCRLFQRTLPLRWLFQFPTVASLAQQIELASAADATDDAVALTTVPRDRPLPLSFAQERLWFLTQLRPDSSFYNVALGMRIRGPLNEEALAAAVDALIMRHESLRTVFPVVDDEPMQSILDGPGNAFASFDLSHTQEADREGIARDRLRHRAEQPFDLAKGPLFRTTLASLSDLEHLFVIEWHHIVNDGWSTAVIFRDLEELYDAHCQRRASRLPALTVQYADYAVWQKRSLTGQRLETLTTFWKRYLAGAPLVLELPTDRARPSVQTYRGADVPVAFSGRLSSALRSLSQEQGVTLFMTLMAAFQVLLSRRTGRDDLVVGTDIANRNRVELESIVGFFVNLLPVRIPLSGDPTFRELLERAATSILAVYAHQDLPFEKMVELLRPERDLKRNPVVQVLFVMQNTEQRALRLPGTAVAPFTLSSTSSRFDLALFVSERENGLEGLWRYNADLFAPATIAALAAGFEDLLTSVVANPDARLSALTASARVAGPPREMPRTRASIRESRPARRRAVDLTEFSAIRTDLLASGVALPLVVRPVAPDVDLVEWAGRNREFVDAKLLERGAVLFRGFSVASAAEFERVARATCPGVLAHRGHPSQVPFHNEAAHLGRWPMRMWLYCAELPAPGGESSIVDGRDVYKAIDPDIRDRFETTGVMYVRTFTDRAEDSWRAFFHTDDRFKVEHYCRGGAIEFQWQEDGGLQIRRAAPAVATHPQTGERVFFNEIQLPHAARSVRHVDVQGQLYYGDGTPIDDEVIRHISEACDARATTFAWQEHDVLMLDNMLVRHARNPFAGERTILVALGSMVEGVGSISSVHGDEHGA